MFFIFGWNHQNITSYGAVKQQQCQNCHNTEFWQLNKISRYFTLFFIPIFPHNSDYWYHCPICNYGVQLDSDMFESYKSIAEVNKAFLEKQIDETERLKQLEEIYKIVDQKTDTKRLKNIEESKDFVEQVVSKTNEELSYILNVKRADYNPAFIVAVEEEIKKRKINNNE
jgi:hypothetical protein